jgi:putative oxidoreductase
MNPEDKPWLDDAGKLVLRLTVGGLMLFHGIHKIEHGVGWMAAPLEARGLPGFLAYGAYLGEIVAPLLMMVGFLTRPAALAVAGTMVMAVFLVLSNQLFSLTEHGGWALELNAFFFFGSVAVALLGPGKWSLPIGRGWWR